MYNSAVVAERIKDLAKSNGIPIKKLLEDVGLGFNTMANMKNSMPKSDNLARIADYLCCSVDYLLGRSSIPELNAAAKLPEEDQRLLSLYHDLDAEGRGEVRGYIAGLLSAQKETPSHGSDVKDA